MITHEKAEKMFEGDTLEIIPSDLRRIVIPAYGFEGAVDAQRQEWGADGPFMQETKGLPFINPKDLAKGATKPNQVLKQGDGVILLYDAPGRPAKVEQYLADHPDTLRDVEGLKHFISYLAAITAEDGGKPDVWEADVAFAAKLKDAPAKEDIKPGMVIVSAKPADLEKDKGQAIFVPKGTVFQGAVGHPQEADEGGAYLVKDKDGTRLVQADAFAKAYVITKRPASISRGKEMD